MSGQSRDVLVSWHVHRAISNFGDGVYLPIKVPYTTVGATVLGLQDSLGLPGIGCGITGHHSVLLQVHALLSVFVGMHFRLPFKVF